MLARLEWLSFQYLPAVLALAVLCAVLVWRLYRPQARQLDPRWAWVMPSLRALALIVLVISILRPVSVRPRTQQEQGAIVILVDRSRSMSIRDLDSPRRSNSELIQLAEGLGLLPRGTRGDSVAAIQAELEKFGDLVGEVLRTQTELDYATLAAQGQPAAAARAQQALDHLKAAAVLADHQTTVPKSLGNSLLTLRRSIDAPDVPRRLGDAASRDAWARELRRQIRNAAEEASRVETREDDQLFKQNPQVKRICDDLRRMSRFELAELALTRPDSGLLWRLPKDVPLFGFAFGEDAQPLPLRRQSQAVQRLRVQPDASASDLNGALTAVTDKLRGQDIQAMIVFSDGQQVGGDSAAPALTGGAGAPIFTIAMGDRSAPDLSIQSVTLPSSQFSGETAIVRARIIRSGSIRAASASTSQPALTLQAHLEAGDTRLSEPLTFNERGVAEVEFSVKLTGTGPQRLVLSADEHPGEVSTANNRIERWIKVLPGRIRVAAYAGTPTWDFQYLRSALLRTPWVQFESAILDDAQSLPLSPQQIRDLGVLILSDVSAKSLSVAQWDAVRQLPVERGGGLILIAGDAHLPAEYAGDVLLSTLLPYGTPGTATWRTWPGEIPSFHLVPAPGAANVDALKFVDDHDRSLWPQLSGFYRYLALPQLKPGTQALLIEKDSGAPVHTRSRLGRGNIFFFGATETWRWRPQLGERHQDQFWLQLVRSAAEEPYAAIQGNLALDAEQLQIQPDQPIDLRARLLNPTDAALPASQPSLPQLRVLRAARVVGEVPLIEQPAASSRFRGRLGGLPEGEYQLELRQPDEAGDPAVLPLLVRTDDEREMMNLAADNRALARLANSSGGDFLTLDQVGQLPQKLAQAATPQSRIASYPLWHSPLLYLFVLACFGAEWALRKRFGLV